MLRVTRSVIGSGTRWHTRNEWVDGMGWDGMGWDGLPVIGRKGWVETTSHVKVFRGKSNRIRQVNNIFVWLVRGAEGTLHTQFW